MTLSKFDWTDKHSVRWFLMLPTGHEGPYSLTDLSSSFSKNKLSSEVMVWAEGLPTAIVLKDLFLHSFDDSLSHHAPPPLPGLPDEDDQLPDLPIEEEESVPPLPESDAVSGPDIPPPAPRRKIPVALIGTALALPVMLFLGYQWIKEQEKFSIRRYPKMSLEVHERIQKAFSFEGWNKPIFFKEFVPADLSSIWLVTSSYHRCEVEALFTSVPEKLLSFKDQRVTFRTKGQLSAHVSEFSRFEFQEGTRIVPGLYEMQVSATNCQWDSLAARMGNRFSPPEASYQATTKVVLFEKGALEFNQLLDQLNHKKMELQNLEKAERNFFWDDLQQKLQTLQAMTLQIEQHLLDLVESSPKDFPLKLAPMIDSYTKKHGHFLTNFVTANETYFQEVSRGKLRDLTVNKNYEEMVRLTSKKVGFAAMKIIEELQTLKKPNATQLKVVRKKILTSFNEVKDDINTKLIDVTEDRAKSP